MKEPNKQQYTQLCLNLIEFKEIAKKTWARDDIIVLEEAIEIIRFYRQFALNKE